MRVGGRKGSSSTLPSKSVSHEGRKFFVGELNVLKAANDWRRDCRGDGNGGHAPRGEEK